MEKDFWEWKVSMLSPDTGRQPSVETFVCKGYSRDTDFVEIYYMSPWKRGNHRLKIQQEEISDFLSEC